MIIMKPKRNEMISYDMINVGSVILLISSLFELGETHRQLLSRGKNPERKVVDFVLDQPWLRYRMVFLIFPEGKPPPRSPGGQLNAVSKR